MDSKFLQGIVKMISFVTRACKAITPSLICLCSLRSQNAFVTVESDDHGGRELTLKSLRKLFRDHLAYGILGGSLLEPCTSRHMDAFDITKALERLWHYSSQGI